MIFIILGLLDKISSEWIADHFFWICAIELLFIDAPVAGILYGSFLREIGAQ